MATWRNPSSRLVTQALVIIIGLLAASHCSNHKYLIITVFCLQRSQRSLPAVRLQSRLQRGDVTKVSCSRSSEQSPNNSTFVVESSFWFGIWPKTNMTKVKDQYGQTLILPMRPDHATTFTAISCQLRSPTSDLPSPQGREKLLCGSSQKRSSSVSEIRCF